jgi:hypothetical protein
VVGRRHQRRAPRGSVGLQPGPRPGAPPARHDGGRRRRGRSCDVLSGRVRRRVAPLAGARPLIASAHSPAGAESATKPDGKGGHDRTLTSGNSPVLTGVSVPKGGHDRTVPGDKCPVVTGVSGAKGGQDQTLFEPAPLERPAQTPAETPAANARARREPLNHRIREDPPSPPDGGSPPDPIVVEQTLLTAGGRTPGASANSSARACSRSGSNR